MRSVGLDPGTRGDRYQLVVHVEAEALAADGGEAFFACRHDEDGRVASGG